MRVRGATEEDDNVVDNAAKLTTEHATINRLRSARASACALWMVAFSAVRRRRRRRPECERRGTALQLQICAPLRLPSLRRIDGSY